MHNFLQVCCQLWRVFFELLIIYYYYYYYYFIANAKININSARSYELKLIHGIGPTIAEKIVSERKRKFFDTMDDLLERVPKFPRSEIHNVVVP